MSLRNALLTTGTPALILLPTRSYLPDRGNKFSWRWPFSTRIILLPLQGNDPVMLQGAMGEKRKADKVSLGLSLNYETGSVLWTWSDS